MISIFEKHKRSLFVTGFSLVLLLSSITLMEFNMVLSSLLFLFSSICAVFYLPFFYFFKKRRAEQSIQSWLQNEIWLLLGTIGFLCLIGAIESSQNYPGFTVVFTSLSVFILSFSYLNLKNKSKKILYWVFFVGNGILIILSNDYLASKQLLDLVVSSYLLLLFLTIAAWIFRQIRFIIQLKSEQTKMELMHLQSQVNPHFFFNTLNNLYGWVEKDPKKAQSLILNLSDMMRYSIYDGQKELVTLEEEIQYLKNYIDLHKMRYHKEINVSFTIEVQEKFTQIRPLLFIILLENAFKHGVENLRKNAFVNIHLSRKAQQLNFQIENNFELEEATTPGIGLKNLKRRLELVYPDKHQLIFSAKENIYRAQLSINLT